MIILLLLILQLLFSLKKANWNKSLVIITIIASVFNVGVLTILHFELMSLGTFTYGSDESDYYQTMLYANNIDGIANWFSFLKDDYNFTYVLFGSLILKTTWFDSIYLVRLGNVLLLINTLVLVYLFIKRFVVENPKNLNFFIFFLGTNGIIIWTAIRNLKDTLFIYALMIFLYILFDIIFKKKLKLTHIVTISLIIYILQDIRQWFIYFLALLLFVIIVVELFKKKRYFLLTIAGGIMLAILLNFAQVGLETLRIYTLNRFSYGASLTQLPILMGQFIMGPGPIRGLFGAEAFLFSTTTGNILISLGSLAWWFFVPVFFMALLSWKNIKQNYVILIVLMFYWMTYSYANMGSGDTRIRAVFYILCVIYTLPYLERIRSKDFPMKYVFVAIPVVAIGLFFSYQTLS